MSTRTCACGNSLDARNTHGMCQRCWMRLPPVRRMQIATLREMLAQVPTSELLRALRLQGHRIDAAEME